MKNLEEKEYRVSLRLASLSDEYKKKFEKENKSQLVKILLEHYYSGQIALLNLSDDILEKYNKDISKSCIVDKLLIEHYSENIVYLDQIQKIKTLGLPNVNEISCSIENTPISSHVTTSIKNELDNTKEVVVTPLEKDIEVIEDNKKATELDEEIIKEFFNLKSTDTSNFNSKDLEKFNSIVQSVDKLIHENNPLFSIEVDDLRLFVNDVNKRIELEVIAEEETEKTIKSRSIFDLTNITPKKPQTNKINNNIDEDISDISTLFK